MGRKLKRERIDRPREERDERDQEGRDLRTGRERDLGRELYLAVPGDQHRTAVLGGVPHDRDDHDATKNSERSARRANSSKRADERVRHERGDEGCDGKHRQRRAQRPADLLGPARQRRERALAAQRARCTTGKRTRGGTTATGTASDGERAAIGIAMKAGDRGEQQRRGRERDQAERGLAADLRSIVPLRPSAMAKPRTSSRFPTIEPTARPARHRSGRRRPRRAR